MKKYIMKFFPIMISSVFILSSCGLINNATVNNDPTKPISTADDNKDKKPNEIVVSENEPKKDTDKDQIDNADNDAKGKDKPVAVIKDSDDKTGENSDKTEPKETIDDDKTDTSNEGPDKTEPQEGDFVPRPGKNHNQKSNAYAYNTMDVRNKMYDSSYKGKKIAFLTFDDGTNNKISPKILDTLKSKNVHATFFNVGYTLNDNTKDVLKRIYDEGHALATHSMNHDYEKLYPNRKADAEYIISEYKSQLEVYRKYLGDDFDTKVWRYPGGHMSWNKDSLKESDRAFADLGVNWIDWNSMNGDAQSNNSNTGGIPKPKTTDQAVKNVEKSAQMWGSPNVLVVLMHDAADKSITADSLAQVIEYLKNEGYEFGILS